MKLKKRSRVNEQHLNLYTTRGRQIMQIGIGLSINSTVTSESAEAITVVLTGSSTYSPGDDFDITATFSSSVTGVTAGDLQTSETMIVGVSGSGAVYTFTLNDDFEEWPSIEITYPADGTNEGNEVSNTLIVTAE